ncbi:hypothetical protein [Salinimonas lutimaris]|uniref:hypothetical protein n=1 Tax=Salinimonas lutimaris TaxID=914153 RepID=UPI0010C0A01D|nr:hypothetical protein [Salinimonas lutimaris]
MKNRKVSLLSLAAIAALSACSSTTPNAPEKPTVNIVQSELPVYAKLSKSDDGRYHFTSFSFNNMGQSINLNNLKHNFNTKEVECEKGLMNNNSAICNDDIEFRGYTVDGGDVLKSTVGNAALALFTGGLGIIGAGAHYTSVFDHDAFDNALKQALGEIDRNTLIAGANNVYQENKRQIDTSNQKLIERLDSIQKSLPKRIKLIDNSGVYNGKPDVSATIKKQVPSLDYSGKWTNLGELKATLNKRADENIETAELKLNCKKHRSFNIITKNCDQKWGVKGRAKLADVEYVVQSANQYRLQPQPELIDEYIEIKVDKFGGVQIANKTDSFVTLNSVSFYFGGDIETEKKIGVEIPPNAIDTSFTLNNYRIYKNNTVIGGFQKKHFDLSKEVGLAVKYKIINSDIEKTLYNTVSLKVRDIGGRVI